MPPLKPGKLADLDAFNTQEARSEDRALWVVDALQEGGRVVFFDRANLREISEGQRVQNAPRSV